MDKAYEVFFEKIAQDYYEDPYAPKKNIISGFTGLAMGGLLGRFGGKALAGKAGEFLAKNPKAIENVTKIFGKVPATQTLERAGKWGGMAAGAATGWGFMS